ncbi:hypothetical protein F3087_29340 [Nocardia colli]|uniref:Uncharacterized protein n=1 Tax=Nocardia colli TaxID=2545717 RepID=A0A5N0EC19_9NOCA|nr:hypothetical protein [Nocardia colli]KAA8885734.1 hypothetical protein F3087_29340 [Nocardia colli]
MTASESIGWQGNTIARCGVVERLNQVGSLVALERVAYAAGATNWYTAHNREDLEKIAHDLRPGSLVSFYFDSRIARAPYTGRVRNELIDFIERDGDALIGWLEPDGVHISMAVVFGAVDIDEEVLDAESDDEVYYGASPARDNDGTDAITVTLPDADGVIRSHAY